MLVLKEQQIIRCENMINLFQLQRTIDRFIPDSWDESVQENVNIIIQIIFFTVLLLIIKRFIETVFSERLAQRLSIRGGHTSQRYNTIRGVIKNLFVYLIYFVYGYIILSLLGVPIGTLLAGAGIAGVAIGLGAQDFISDMINGFFIIIEDQYKVGDFIQIHDEQIEGTVIELGIRSTTLRAASGEIYFIPNNMINIVNNRSRHTRQINIEMPVNDDYDISKLEEVVADTTKLIYKEYEHIMRDEPQIIGIVRGEGYSFHYRVSFLVEQGQEYRHTSIFYRVFFRTFQDAQITFPTSLYEV